MCVCEDVSEVGHECGRGGRDDTRAHRPLVSIGLPVFNGEDYLAEAIDSILAQSYGDFELIIADNASTDRPEALCRSYAAQDKRIRYYRFAENGGAALNYNRCVSLARGEFFKWVAHDDVCEPKFIEGCLVEFDQGPSSIVAVHPRSVFIDEAGSVLGEYDRSMDVRHRAVHERLLIRLSRLIMYCWSSCRCLATSTKCPRCCHDVECIL